MFGVDTLTSSSITFRALLVVGSAIGILILLGRGKPARASWWIPPSRRPDPVLEVHQAPVKVLRRARPPLWRKLIAIIALPTLSTMIGLVIAVVVSVGAIRVVTGLTDLLRK
jgi:hypothetical protein